MPNKRTREKKKEKKAKKMQIIYHIRIQNISNKNINWTREKSRWT